MLAEMNRDEKMKEEWFISFKEELDKIEYKGWKCNDFCGSHYFYNSTKSWRGYIFTAVCLSVLQFV